MDPSTNMMRSELQGQFQAMLIRVFNYDGKERVISVRQERPTADEVLQIASEKEGLSQSGRRLFSLWIEGPELSLRLRPTLTLVEAVQRWSKWVKRFAHDIRKQSRQFRFILKRDILMHPAYEMKLQEEVSMKLLVGEARSNVMVGLYPCNAYEAVLLAAMQMQIMHGDYSATRCKVESLASTVHELIPSYLLKTMKSQDWAQRIVDEYTTHAGETTKATLNSYLTFVRQWHFYGCAWYTACRNVPPNGYYEHRTDHLWVGINSFGIHVLDDDKHKLILSEPYESIAWEASEDMFILEYGPETRPIELHLITPQAPLLDQLASRAVESIERQL